MGQQQQNVQQARQNSAYIELQKEVNQITAATNVNPDKVESVLEQKTRQDAILQANNRIIDDHNNANHDSVAEDIY